MPIENMAKRLIPSEKIPHVVRTDSQMWLDSILAIPAGQALEMNQDEIGMTTSSLRGLIRRFKETKQIAENYIIRERKALGKVYIENTAKPSKKPQKD